MSLSPIEGSSREEIINNGVLYIKCRTLEINPRKTVLLAGFDVDGTLVATKSGATFARGGQDWRLLPFANDLKSRIQQLQTEFPEHQCVCVLFTNQGGVVTRQSSKAYINLITKLTGICNTLGCVDFVYASLRAEDSIKIKYRKPAKGMFDLFAKGVPEIDFNTSFYVGDAAGRPQDHSSDDINFAKNVGITFITPEEYFVEKNSDQK